MGLKRILTIGFCLVVLLLGMVTAGGAFYQYVLPRFHQPAPPPPPKPKPKKVKDPLYAINPTKATAVPQVAALPGTTVVRLAHQTSNAHQPWALANMGKVTDPGSIFARNGITMQFRHLDKPAQRIAALKAMAVLFNRGETLADAPDSQAKRAGVHFFIIAGDVSGWALSQTNNALKSVNPDFEAEILGFAGVSAGEDKFLGPPEWRINPLNAIGGVAAGVPYSSAWNVMVFWCAQNDIPFNADQDYYDPNALNLVETKSPEAAAEMYIQTARVERIFVGPGQDYKRRQVEPGQKRSVFINGVATRTPLESYIASERGGLVMVASTKQYPNQAPQLIVGLKQWNRRNRDVVTQMLVSVFEASQHIDKSHRDLKAKRIEPKSDDDARWQAAQYVYELLGTGSPDDWYAYYDVTGIEDRDKRKLIVETGGVAVSSLQRNLLYFGFGESGPDIGKVIYGRFTQLARQYDPHFTAAVPEWETAFTKRYVEEVIRHYSELAHADPKLPSFTVELVKEPLEYTYHIAYEVTEETFTADSELVLSQALERLIEVGKAKVEIHGYADSSGETEDNLELSRRRGEAVYDWLKVRLGASFPEDVQVIAHGEDNLLVQDRIDGQYVHELMVQNRRVILKIIPL